MAGRHARGRVTESSEYAAAVERMLWAMGRRVGADPGALTHLPHLAEVLRDAENLGIAQAHDAGWPYSAIAAVLGVSKQAIIKRYRLGLAARARLESGSPVVRLADVRSRRAQRHQAAGIADATAGPRERQASGR